MFWVHIFQIGYYSRSRRVFTEGEPLALRCHGWKNKLVYNVLFYQNGKTFKFSPQNSEFTILKTNLSHKLFPAPVLTASLSFPLLEGNLVNLSCETKLLPQKPGLQLYFSFYELQRKKKWNLEISLGSDHGKKVTSYLQKDRYLEEELKCQEQEELQERTHQEKPWEETPGSCLSVRVPCPIGRQNVTAAFLKKLNPALQLSTEAAAASERGPSGAEAGRVHAFCNRLPKSREKYLLPQSQQWQEISSGQVGGRGGGRVEERKGRECQIRPGTQKSTQLGGCSLISDVIVCSGPAGVRIRLPNEPGGHLQRNRAAEKPLRRSGGMEGGLDPARELSGGATPRPLVAVAASAAA
eukprot:bmy_19720T0